MCLTECVPAQGYALMAKYVVPVMKEKRSGSIINVGSISSFIAQPAFVPYNTTKGAILQLTRCLAMDVGEWGIRVNTVCPGWRTFTSILTRTFLTLSIQGA